MALAIYTAACSLAPAAELLGLVNQCPNELMRDPMGSLINSLHHLMGYPIN